MHPENFRNFNSFQVYFNVFIILSDLIEFEINF